MHRFRLAVATRCFDRPLREALSAAAATGAEGVQFDLRQELNPAELRESARRELRHVLDELGLRVAGTTFTLRRPLADEHELDRRIAALKQAMTCSYDLQSRVLTVRIGRIPNDADSKEAQIFREVVDDLARYANHVGVVLAFTPAHDAPDDLHRLVSSVESGPVGIDFDPAQFAMSGRDPVAALRTLHAFTYHVQLRDGLADLEGASAETAVGDGAVPWIEVLAMLSEMDYSGWLTAVRTQGSDKRADIAHAVAFVRRLLLGG